MSVVRQRLVDLPGVLARTVRGIRTVPPAARREYAIVLALAFVAELGLRSVGAGRTARLLGVQIRSTSVPSDSRPAHLPSWSAARMRVVRKVMQRWPVDGECLRESLVLASRLRTLSPIVRIGVTREHDLVRAHAWVEVAGRSLDPTSDRYHPLLGV